MLVVSFFVCLSVNVRTLDVSPITANHRDTTEGLGQLMTVSPITYVA